MVSATVRYGGLVAVVGGYLAILGYGAVTGTTTAAVTDLYLGALLLAAIGARYIWDGGREPSVFETGGFVIAGVAMLYTGGSVLAAVPSIEYVETVGDIALFVAAFFLLYRISATSQQPTVGMKGN